MSSTPTLSLRDVPPRVAFALEQAGVHPLLARLFAARGVRSADDLQRAFGQALGTSEYVAQTIQWKVVPATNGNGNGGGARK